ncbi:MAG: hypothetical protein EA396_12335 [Anaerolineaceae bacterium]|nr:MAG: hypothetical protein EA396_12335 [Anaerolineaceae bacterium]
MARLAQIGIAISTIGVLMMLIGLYPGVTGIEPTPGVGILQIITMLSGLTLFILGALMYVKYTFFANQTATLAQSIGTRLALTGLLLAVLVGMADVLGYGSHGAQMEEPNVLGPLQAAGIIGSYALSCFGVLVYAVAGAMMPDKNDSASRKRSTAETAQVADQTTGSADQTQESAAVRQARGSSQSSPEQQKEETVP